jgi:GNAT superfamily N-acetyltransferase
MEFVMMHLDEGWMLVRPTMRHAADIAGWSRSAQEAGYWCAGAHPFPVTAVTAWWGAEGLSPWVLLNADGVPVAYGELWDSEDEDESELARLIVDPDRRGNGIAQRLIRGLLALAQFDGRSRCVIRVAPGNEGVLGAGRLAGFREVDEATAVGWNHDQPTDYRWLERRAFPTAATA